ncbi:YaaA family protein [Naumannella huperziae]
MLILLPPSEGKRRPVRGRSLDLSALSFPDLAGLREQVIAATVEAAGRSDAARLFGVSAGLAGEVARNAALASAPTARADRVYDGVLYRALDPGSLDAAARRRAGRWLVISSALFGALRPADRIPAYKLSMGARLPGLPGLAALWRTALRGPLDAAAGTGLVVDCRSGSYAAAWRPAPPARWVRVEVPGATHDAKFARGLVARAVCAHPGVPTTPEDLADLLPAGWVVGLDTRSAPAARLEVSAPAGSAVP